MAERDVRGAIIGRLEAAGVPAPAADARWLLAHANAGGTLDHDQLEALVVRREHHEPLQLILGSWPFRTVELSLDAGVFLPRPETEVVAGVAIDHALRLGPGAVVAEPCTGSGAIACSLLAEVPGVRVIATDLDPTAVALARRNLATVDPHGDAQVLTGDLLEPLPAALRGHLDVLVANPPYLPSDERGQLPREVVEHDPQTALFGGEDGHEVVDALLAAAAGWLRPGGVVILELDERRGADAVEVARRLGLAEVQLIPDLAGRDRAIVASIPAVPVCP
ncbi:MAG: peptide chain release factor N(5)-glutamine methyltransferase [Nitriliruptoraceae bacterium]